ncbi:MAG: PAS domain S-box protein [Deltaproteobacteria bacterium]|nr:PAS domain S-box protein [Deltaproteobacteria bacterium]
MESFLDITEQKDFEKALMQSEEGYRILAENVPDGVALMQGGRFLMVNRAFAAMSGYAGPEDLVGRQSNDPTADSHKEIYVYVNLKGRDKGGIVEPEDYEKVQQEIINALKAAGVETRSVSAKAGIEKEKDEILRTRYTRLLLELEVGVDEKDATSFERVREDMERGSLLTYSLDEGIEVEYDVRRV